MRFGILGPLEVSEDGRTLHVGGPKPRTLLAVLLVHANQTVSIDRLVDAAWPGRPTDEVANALHTQLTRLRGVIGRGESRRLERRGAGYVLHLGVDELDAFTFEDLSRRARQALDAGDARAAAEAAGQALACWRGDALGDFAGEEFAEARATQLEEQRLLTVECHVDARLALGEHSEVVGPVRELVSRHPERESLWSRLILALYRSGRQSDALRAYREVHELLVEEYGISPRADLVELERRVLEQDPGLDWAGGPDVAPPAAGHPVTFLFTDVDQGTVLWDRDPTAMGEALRAHDAVLRAAIESRHGRVFARPGDGFCAVFDRAADAVAAALDAQRRLRRPQSGALELSARMALHTGEAEPRDGSYVGAAVNRTARLRDAGHGAQILVSAATRELVLDTLPAPADLVDVGTWLFEGSSRPERVYQLAHPELATGFPPLRAGRQQTGRLPRHATSFVGRAGEVEQTLACLGAGRLVTLTGEGGVGKTRLALEVAQRIDYADYPDGVWFCDVSTVQDAEGLVDHVAAGLGLATPAGTDVRRAVTAALQGVRLLLLIDNCEGLRAPVGELLGDVMASGSEATILVTSRAPLRVAGERVVQVGPLALPAAEGPDAAESPAVQLLLDRAAAAGAPVSDADPDPALVEIVRRLDGIPLAIELAAPRLAAMSARALAGRLDRSFDLLAGSTTRPVRQRTLRATIDWSFELLTDDARTLFGALSVFRGGWTLDTAELVGAAVDVKPDAVAPLVADLTEQSMVRVDLPPGGLARYDMLATMQAYAAEYLARSGRRHAAAECHAEHFVGLAERAVPHRRGPMEPAWVSQLAVEFDNLRAAYRWSIDSGQPERALRLVAALADDVIMRERLEIGRWAEELAGRPDVAPEPLRAVALALAGNTAMVEGRLDDARRLSDEAVAHARATGSRTFWVAHNTLALLAVADQSDRGRPHLDAMVEITHETGDPLPAAVAHFARVLVASLAGEPERGAASSEALLEGARTWDNPSLRAMALLSHGRVVAGTDAELASRRYHAALEVASTAHNTLLAQQSLRAIEELNARSGDRSAALASLRALVRRFEESGNVSEQMQTILSMLDPLVAMGAYQPAATICGALSPTPWRLTAGCRLIDRTVADRLPREEYTQARRRGASMTPADLVAFVFALVQDLGGA